jgi:branched-chain amino acid transport system substrate-binding protein
MTMRRLAIALVLCCTLGIAACGSDDGGGNDTASGNQPIVIGAAIAETGILSAYDIPAFEAFKLKVDEVNEAGGIDGREVEIETADTKSEIETGSRVARGLVDQGVDMMVVTCDFDFGSPAALVAQDAGLVSMSLCAQSPRFGVQGIGDKAYTVSPSVNTEGVILGTFAGERGYEKAFLLLDTTIAYDEGLCDGFTKGFEAEGGEIVGTETFENADPSISSQVSRVKSSDADSVVLCSYTPGGASALRQIRASGIDLPILSGGGMDGTYWVESAPGISDLFVTTQVSVFGDDESQEVNDFVRKYRKTTGEAPATAYAAIGYSAAEALTKALEENGGDAEGEALKEALDGFEGEELLIGPTTFTSEAHIPLDRPMRVLEYTNGKPAVIDTVAPGVEVGVAG